jgi:peptidoglycan/LPS O-acetylase OafA/YrhL
MGDVLHGPLTLRREIPSLDGLRAFSIFLVIALHTMLRHTLYKDLPFAYRLVGDGTLGVSIFFVISGYLITTLLLREQAEQGFIRLGRFYVRRAFKILPPFYAYLLFLTLLQASGHLPGMTPHELIAALTLTRNYSHHVDLWALEHTWSLCIEEQFYVLWPPVLVFCALRRGGANGRLLATRVALAVIFLEPAIRVMSFRYLPTLHNTGMFHMQADGLMFGAIGALQQGQTRFERIYAAATRRAWMLPLLIFFVLGSLTVAFGNYWELTVGMTINSFFVLMWMLWLVRNPGTIAGRIMNYSAVMWIGRLSYSLYLWQTFFLHQRVEEVFGHDGWWDTFPGSWLCILTVATLSYYGIERPARQVRDVCLRWISSKSRMKLMHAR